MCSPLPGFAAALAAFALRAVSTVAVSSMAFGQSPTPTADKPVTKPVRSIPYVSITGEDGRQRHYETNAIPLLFNRACFGWRMYLGGPHRTVTPTEVLTTSQPAAQVVAGPQTAGRARKTKAPPPM